LGNKKREREREREKENRNKSCGKIIEPQRHKEHKGVKK
jgi:hypothetical protein